MKKPSDYRKIGDLNVSSGPVLEAGGAGNKPQNTVRRRIEALEAICLVLADLVLLDSHETATPEQEEILRATLLGLRAVVDKG